MTQGEAQQRAEFLKQAKSTGLLQVSSVDFSCGNCGCVFDFITHKKLHPSTFVIAHLKACTLAYRAPRAP